MAKEMLDALPVTNSQQKASTLKIFSLALVLAGCLLLTAHYDAFTKREILVRGHPTYEGVLASTKEFEWDKLRVSSALYWVPCYEGFECARLEVSASLHIFGEVTHFNNRFP
jgi:hypothetical protein